MLKILKYIFGVITVLLAGYGLLTKNFQFAPWMLVAMSGFTLVMGISKFKEDQRGTGLNLMFASAFGFVVVLVILFLE